MIKPFLEQYCQQNGWHFEYGRSDFHNLEVRDDNALFYLFLDPITQEIKFNEYNQATNYTEQGRFLLVMHSDFDRVYHSQQSNDPAQGKYEKYIRPCKQALLGLLQGLTCLPEVTPLKWTITEVINLLDNNFDGVLVEFTLKNQE